MESDESLLIATLKSIDTSDNLALRTWFKMASGLTVPELCKLSGKNRLTIQKWRHRAGINAVYMVEYGNKIITSYLGATKTVRGEKWHKSSPDAIRRPWWTKRIITRLRGLDLVSNLRQGHNCCTVHYKTGMKRTYAFGPTKIKHRYMRQISRADAIKSWPVMISSEHEWNPFDRAEIERLSGYFHIPRNRIIPCTKMDLEILVQTVIYKILSLGYIQPYMSMANIDKEIDDLHADHPLFYRGMVDLYARVLDGRPIRGLMETYYDIGDMHRDNPLKTMRRAFANTRILFSALYELLYRTRWDINITSLFRILYGRQYGPKWFDPYVFAAIIRDLLGPIGGRTIIDASPNMNEKAITAWMLDCGYYAMDGSTPPKGLVDKLGIRLATPTQPYDLVIADNGFVPFELDQIRNLRDSAHQLLVFVGRGQVEALNATMPPTNIVKIKTAPIRSPSTLPNYLFAYL